MGDSLQVGAVGAGDLARRYDELARMFERFEDKFPDEKKWPDLALDIGAGDYQLWTVSDGGKLTALALTFLKIDAKKTCVISHCAGENYKQWAGQLLATIRVWSFSQGSTKLEIVARPGWERELRRFGMIKKQVILELG